MREPATSRPPKGVLALELTATFLAGMIFALIGPFGTFEQARLSERLVYWVAVTGVAFLIYRPACALAARLAESRGAPVPLAWAGAIVVATFPLTLLVWLASYRHTPSLWPGLVDYLGFYGSVFTIGAALMLVLWFVRRGADAQRFNVAQLAAVPPPVPPRILARLEPRARGELIALEMEDHYVRVHTGEGSVLLLMRMADAVSESEGVEGARVHRSWWVARKAVAGASRRGRAILLTLSNGLQVPVARERLSGLPTWLKSAL